eukprot:Platyproteum_vivax@DN7128_c0_g1_i1.p1
MGSAFLNLSNVSGTDLVVTVTAINPSTPKTTAFALELLENTDVTHRGSVAGFEVVDLGPVGKDAFCVYSSKEDSTDKAVFGFKVTDADVKMIQISKTTADYTLSTTVAEKSLGKDTHLAKLDDANKVTAVSSLVNVDKVTYAKVSVEADKLY